MADMKITDLAAATDSDMTPQTLLEAVIDPGGTPLSRKVTIQQLARGMGGGTPGFLSIAADGTPQTRVFKVASGHPAAFTYGGGVAGAPELALTMASTEDAETGTGTGLMNPQLTAAAIAAQGGGGGGWTLTGPNGGLIYSHAVNGAQANVSLTGMAAGYDYGFWLESVQSASSMVRKQFIVQLQLDGAGWSTAIPLNPLVSFAPGSSFDMAGALITGFFWIPRANMAATVARVVSEHLIRAGGGTAGGTLVSPAISTDEWGNPAGGMVNNPGQYASLLFNAAKAVTGLRMNWSFGNINGGTVRAYRRAAPALA